MSYAETDGRVEGLRALFRTYAEELSGSEMEQSCIDNHMKFWMMHDDLNNAVISKGLGRERYLELFNRLAREMFLIDKRILGEDAFFRVFGEDAEDIEGLIEPSIFLGGAPHNEHIKYG